MPAFLSDAWFDEVDKLLADAPEATGPGADLVLNIVVTGGPDGEKELHVNAGKYARGLVDEAPTKLKVPYDVAKDIFINNNQAAGMQAFMAGQIQVEGDMTKLMAMQGGAPSPEQAEFSKKIQAITD